MTDNTGRPGENTKNARLAALIRERGIPDAVFRVFPATGLGRLLSTALLNVASTQCCPVPIQLNFFAINV